MGRDGQAWAGMGSGNTCESKGEESEEGRRNCTVSVSGGERGAEVRLDSSQGLGLVTCV